MEKPTYFSILTATVRYCPNIGDFERVLYSEISSLTHKWGFCTASNDYLGELYNKAPETISRSISKLVKAGHLVIQIDQKGNNPRKIYLAETAHLLTKTSTPLDENVNRPLDENVKHNNTSNNNKLNKAKRSPRSATVEDKLSKVEGLKDDIGETQYKLLNCILSDEAYYSKLRKLYAEDKFKFLRDWLRYRKERKNAYRIAAPIRLVINSLLENTNEDCAAALRSSVMNQYQGLFVKPSFSNPSRPGYQQ